MNAKQNAMGRFSGIRKQVSMFLFTALAGFAALVTLVAYKQGMFVPHTDIYFHAPDATGINKGMAVRLHGVPVGMVREVELVERGVRVRLGINNDYLPRLPRSAQARITREGYVGVASIQIITPGLDRTPVAEGEEIRFIAQKGMADMLDEVRAQMTPAFQELRRAAAEMGDPSSDFRKSVTALRVLIEELPQANRDLRQLLRTTDRTMNALGKQAESVGVQAELTLDTLARLGSQSEQQMPMLTEKLANTLDSLNATALQVQETTKVNGDALRELLTQAPELMRGSNELVRDSQEIAGAARRSWLLRDYIEPSEMRTLPVDSFESFGKR
jgi:phospholipid/cholesterol/gamma-HCH transport system substrate-binding protein